MKRNFKSGESNKRILYGIVKYSVLAAIMLYLVLCISMRLSIRNPKDRIGECTVYYMVNYDGMKGLGHSILVLVDEAGNGTVFSFNGMQRNLWEALLGKAGVGKMSVGKMEAVQMQEFLQTGNLELEGDQLQDNYDLAIYRNITGDEYDAVLQAAEIYIETGDEYEELYARYISADDEAIRMEYKRQLAEMGNDDSLPLYRIYTNNCDHVARSLIACVDEEMAGYNAKTHRMTPNGNLKFFGTRTETWGVMELGENSFGENILQFLMIF